MRYTTFIILALLCAAFATAQTDSIATDSVPKKRNIFQRIGDYISGKNEKPDTIAPHKPRWIVLGGPHYSSEEKLGIALSGMATFRLNGCDATMQPSAGLVFADISTAGFWNFGFQGDILFPNDSRRIHGKMRVRYSPYNFWGIGYEKGNTDSLKTQLHQHEVIVEGSMLWRLANGLYLGPTASYNFVTSGNISRPELLEGQRKSTGQVGAGFTLLYDTRDFINNAASGQIIQLDQLFHPRFIGNHYTFARTDLRASIYRTVWKGGIIAADLRTTFNFGSPSWASLALLGGNETMRGYYTGRFRDKHLYSVQVELRQRVWRRNGIVVWAGAGNVFHDWKSFKAHVLPNFGIGYRWEVRPRMNLRLDFGFGKKGHSGFTFSMYEAF